MSKRFNYGVYSVGRIDRVHAAIVREQGQRIVAAQQELDIGAVQTFTNAAEMAHTLAGEIDAVIIASRTRDHARHALPFVRAQIPVYLGKPLTHDLGEAFAFVETIGRDPHQL